MLFIALVDEEIVPFIKSATTETASIAATMSNIVSIEICAFSSFNKQFIFFTFISLQT